MNSQELQQDIPDQVDEAAQRVRLAERTPTGNYIHEYWRYLGTIPVNNDSDPLFTIGGPKHQPSQYIESTNIIPGSY